MYSHELAEKLLSRPNVLVLAASDEEGNSFNPIVDYSIELIEKSSDGYDADLFTREDLISEGDYEEHEIDGAFKDVVVLWP